ncbi:MAG: hypothetical protein U0Q12_16385 [Vicinamibacterales bacterium]
MTIPVIVLAFWSLPSPPIQQPPAEVPLLRAEIGPCSADFTVKDADGAGVYAAAIKVRVRYGVKGIKRADLEVGTNSDGKARIEGLPSKARPLVYAIEKAGKVASLRQDVEHQCHAALEVTLK